MLSKCAPSRNTLCWLYLNPKIWSSWQSSFTSDTSDWPVGYSNLVFLHRSGTGSLLVTDTETLLLPTCQRFNFQCLSWNAMQPYCLKGTWWPRSEGSRPPGCGRSDDQPGGWIAAARRRPAPHWPPALTRQGGCRWASDWRPPAAAADMKWPHRTSGKTKRECWLCWFFL